MTIDLRALIFDLDGVIADTNTPHRASWERLSREEGIPFSPPLYQQMMGLPRRACLDVFLNGRPINEATARDYLHRKNIYFLELLENFTPEDAAPGVLELIDEARAAGLRVGLGSSSQNARLVLKKLGLYDYFDVIGDGTTVTRTKPAPDIFLWVAAQFGIQPAQAIVFEDSTAGMTAARAGGFYVVALGDEPGDADLRLPTLAGATLERLTLALAPQAS